MFKISEHCYRYEPNKSDENEIIAQNLIELIEHENTWGLGLCFLYLRNVIGKT
jgi:putative transposase